METCKISNQKLVLWACSKLERKPVPVTYFTEHSHQSKYRKNFFYQIPIVTHYTHYQIHVAHILKAFNPKKAGRRG